MLPNVCLLPYEMYCNASSTYVSYHSYTVCGDFYLHFFQMEEALQFSKLGKFFVDAEVVEFRYVCMFVII